MTITEARQILYKRWEFERKTAEEWKKEWGKVRGAGTNEEDIVRDNYLRHIGIRVAIAELLFEIFSVEVY